MKLSDLYLKTSALAEKLFSPFGSLVLLILRLYWGWQFFRTGLGKLQNIERVIAFFTSLGIPAPAVNAYFVGTLEMVGGLLLLKGQDNSSSGNERYAEKLRTYTASAPCLARTLVPDFYKSNSAMNRFMEDSGLQFAAASHFTRETLEQRSELLYDMTKKIWGV